jgi:hypothetical protein
MKKTWIVFLIYAALSSMLSAQIPEQGRWEITFSQVEAAANLPTIRNEPSESLEARVMERPWSASAPLPFMRLVRIDGTVHAQLFVFWATKNVPPGGQPSGSGIVCRDGVCVRPIEIKEKRDWGQVLSSLAYQDACPIRSRGIVSGCADCEQIWIKTIADANYREQSCQQPSPETLAGAMLEVMKVSVQGLR